MPEGILYIVATPIGNLEDITMRAVRILKEEVAYIYCEDTRQTRKLLQHYGIQTKTRSLHTHSSDKQFQDAITLLQQGVSLAYVTDCGTPGISDPGNKLVQEARLHDIIACPIPGPSALTALASVCGFPEKNLIFGGFLSKKEGKRKNELEKLKAVQGIIIIYESPHRIKKTLNAIHEIFPGADVLIGREMTKMFEEFIAGNIDSLCATEETIKEKGEFAIAILNNKK